MLSTYEDYEPEPMSLTLEEMASLHREMADETRGDAEAINMLARYLRMQGKSASWRDTLGEESENPYYRKRIGDFACYLVFIGSLNAR